LVSFQSGRSFYQVEHPFKSTSMALPPKAPFDLPASSQARDPLTREALAWLVHLHSGEETAQDWADFQDWKAADDVHANAARQAEKLWEQLGPALVQQRKSGNKTIPVLLAGAVALAGIAFAAGLFGPPASFFADYRSGVGEIRSVTLRDGSQVDLDSGTSFDVDVGHRTITLHTGQIHVAVKPNPDRPFTVIAGEGSVRALGTAFAVRRDGDGATVVVTEHAVRVTHAHGHESRSAEIAAGEAISYSPGGLGRARKADLATLTAWRRGELIFDGRPLGDVVAEMDRYRRGRILILDEAIRRLPVTGNFEIADADAFFESIQLALPVSVTVMPGLTVIRRDPARTMPAR
jgi:transmembrane sensor